MVLIHQIRPKPDALRVKIWRRLQQIGAVAIKQSVYVMPFSEQSREVKTQRLNLNNSGLVALAEVIHDIDLKDNKYNRGETVGLNALLTGLAASESDDEKRVTRGADLMENLYAFFQRQKGN